MSRLAKWWLVPAFLFVCPSLVRAQSCTSVACNAVDCSRSSILAALPAPSNSNATVVVNIPGCPTTGWTSNINYSVPAAVTSLTIQGQTTCTGSGDPAQNNLSCSDVTTIQDNDTTDSSVLLSVVSKGFLRITGLTIEFGSGSTKNGGMLNVAAGTLRLDHNHFTGDTFAGGAVDTDMVFVGGCTSGVADHDLFSHMQGWNGASIVVYNGEGCNGTTGSDYPWAQPTGFGTGTAFYVEQSLLTNNSTWGSQQANDCLHGGRQVFRFNTLYNGDHFQTHPTGSSKDVRGCRSTEIYGNHWLFTLPNPGTVNTVFTVFFYSSGVAMVWGNIAQPGYSNFVNLEDCRSGSNGSGGTRCGYTPVSPPNGWGVCGGPSAWDGNTNSSGYPCIDQPGRGQGDLITGTFSSKMDSAMGAIAWPHQKLEPLYYWLNSYSPLPNGNGSVNPIVQNGNIWTQNVDYYVSSDQNSGTDCNGFTGATGVGCGPRASRPSTCTTGVGWWSTDQGNWNQTGNGFGNGVLDICTSTNNWTNASYAPYTYPHPLAGGSVAPPPAPPTNPQVSVN